MQKLGRKTWLAIVLFSLCGQVAWTIENMLFNVFISEEFGASLNNIALMVSISAIAATVTTLFMAEKFNDSAWIVLITFLFYALAGFQDDFLKLKGHENRGLSPRGKLFRQILIALIPTLYAMQSYGTVLTFGSKSFDIGLLYPLFCVFVVTGASNAYNLTDGLDGLAGNLSLSVLLGMFIIGKVEKNELLVVTSIVIFFSIIAFLCFNFHTALVFMGNVGSHAIGSAIAITAILSKNEFYIGIFGLVFVFETLSVILQVLYFRKTKGKRLFKMAPFHHHLEIVGYNEGSISIILVLISLLLVIISLLMKGI